MVSSKKVSGRASPFPVGIAMGVLTGITITALMSMALTYMVLTGVLDSRLIGYGVMVIIGLSVILGDLIALIRIKRRGMLVAQLTGGIYLLALLGATALLFGGQYRGVGVTALLVAGTNTLVGVISLWQKQRPIKHGRKLKTW